MQIIHNVIWYNGILSSSSIDPIIPVSYLKYITWFQVLFCHIECELFKVSSYDDIKKMILSC